MEVKGNDKGARNSGEDVIENGETWNRLMCIWERLQGMIIHTLVLVAEKMMIWEAAEMELEKTGK